MTDSEIIKFVQDIAQLQPYGMCFCGGEPLLKLKLLLKCADILYNGGVKNISMVFNGYFVTEGIRADGSIANLVTSFLLKNLSLNHKFV